VGYRSKQILTVLSCVDAQRAYYHCPDCQSGLVPKARAFCWCQS
jgi:hypothetical protein